MSRRVGQILRETRENKNLTVRDVSKDTNIAVKFILALENEDYSQFPAETFTMGFLKTYSDYLKLDTAMILNMYRGEQVEDSQPPYEELTKPTRPIVETVSTDKNKFVIIGAGVLVLIMAGGYYVYENLIKQKSSNVSPILTTTPDIKTTNPPITTTSTNPPDDSSTASLIPKDINFVLQNISDSADAPSVTILSPERGISFSIGGQSCKLFIQKVNNSEDPQNSVAVYGFNIAPEKKVYTFESKANKEVILSNSIADLSNLKRDVIIKTQTVSFKSSKIAISLSSEKQTSKVGKTNSTIAIQVSMNFIKSTFIEIVADGNTIEKNRVKKGETRNFEAENKLEINVGDGSAVELSQGGKEKIRLSSTPKLMKKVYTKVPNPYDNTQFIIKEIGDKN